MDIDALLTTSANRTTRLPALRVGPGGERSPDTADALFHLPLLALALLTVARPGPFPTSRAARSVATLFVEQYASLRNGERSLLNSITLRRRCAEALVFLEISGLVEVSNDDKRLVKLTPTGTQRFDRFRHKDATDIGVLVRALRKAQARVQARLGDQ